MTTNSRQTETFLKLSYVNNVLSISTNGIYLSINPQEIAMCKDMLFAFAPKMLEAFGVTEGKFKDFLDGYGKAFVSNLIDGYAISFANSEGSFDVKYTLNENGNINCKFEGDVDFHLLNYLSDLKNLINQITEGE